jgi:uncharacterized protein YlzI (FlbEa/FlbD family)
MIILHRLGHTDEPFQLNPDLIVTVESTPDTVVTLATTAKVVVAESPGEVAAAVREWRVGVLSEAMRNRRGGPGIDSGGNDSPPTPIKSPDRRAEPLEGSRPPASQSRRPERVEGSRLPADERGR